LVGSVRPLPSTWSAVEQEAGRSQPCS
jgi:hypothetical protein